MNDTPNTSTADSWASTPEELNELRLIYATVITGARFVLRALTLDELAALEGLPDDVLKVALLEMTEGGIAGEIRHHLDNDDEAAGLERRARNLSHSNTELINRLVKAAVVEPKLTDDQIRDLDGFDKAMIAAIVSRRIQYDAAGKRVGVEPLDTFATFLREHGCTSSCEACQASRLALSTVQPG